LTQGSVPLSLTKHLANSSADTTDLEALESYVRRQTLQLAARAVERRLNADLSDGERRPRTCSCGRPARYAGRCPKTFETVLGPLAELAGVTVCAKRVERVAEALGRESAAAESATVFDCEAPSAPTMYLGIDGTGVPMRPKELAGRSGKQADGSARTREAKLVVIWTAEQRDDDGRAVCDAGSATYSAAIDSAACRDTDPEQSAFARRVWREAERRGFPRAERRVILGDGAKWIWRVACELFPGAIQIVDFYHVAERLWDVAKDLLRDDREAAETWAEARCSELREGHLNSVLATLKAHAGHCKMAAECEAYIETNRDRMRYADFRAQGLQIGSGVVEAGCKSVAGARLKQSGMRWTKDGAQGILALRACILGGRYEDFWAWRSESRQAAAA
ncbi:MAG: ISKra4 family transposase, partial [Bryobacterales bacterium]|nr:ISKra4 family transposase [Bryobacterales bacterium]